MAASKPVVEPQSVAAGLPRWQLALLVGTPIVLGVGAVYLWKRSRSNTGRKEKDAEEEADGGERKTPEGSAGPALQEGRGRELESMVRCGGSGSGCRGDTRLAVHVLCLCRGCRVVFPPSPSRGRQHVVVSSRTRRRRLAHMLSDVSSVAT